MGKRNSTDGLESRPYLTWIRQGQSSKRFETGRREKLQAKQGVLQFEQVTRGRFEKSEPIHRAGPG